MGYAPTLGGLYKLQEFLTQHGHEMPIFFMDIDNATAGYEWSLSSQHQGRKITIERAIKKYGKTSAVMNVKLSSECERRSIIFSSPTHLSLNNHCERDVISPRMPSVVLSYVARENEFLHFVSGKDIHSKIINLSRWGKEDVTRGDRILFSLFPWYYAKKSF